MNDLPWRPSKATLSSIVHIVIIVVVGKAHTHHDGRENQTKAQDNSPFCMKRCRLPAEQNAEQRPQQNIRTREKVDYCVCK
jgi:hypothetical protein